jgi:hypothetical protein
VLHVTNIDFSLSFGFGSQVLPRPRRTAAPVAVAPWTLPTVSVAAQRHVEPGMGVGVVCAGVVSGLGARPYAGPRLAMPAQQTVRNPIIRKHNVHQTRVNAGGDGASGPHPERGPA